MQEPCFKPIQTPLNLLLGDEGSSALPCLSDFLPALPAALLLPLTAICDLWPVLAQSQKPKFEAGW